MNHIHGKIILIDDNSLEEELMLECVTKGHWHAEVKYFDNAEDALKYLRVTNDIIFLIICDMNMPRMSGLDLKKVIDADKSLRSKVIPFIFATTTATNAEIKEAYEYGIQGYFEKPMDLDKICEMIEIIFNYWLLCLHPNKMT
jgi:response regulator RpfG family c-di-GMP phosphodiesterase